MKKKAIVVFSGGQDSTTCLFWALKKFDEVELVTFNYGQRHSQEILVAERIAEDLKLTHRVLDVELLNQLTKTSLTREIDIEQEDGELPNTFVPGRNLLFLSLAGIIAQQKGFTELVTGVSQTDFSGYPDCREDFIKSMQMTLNLAMETSLTIHTPLMHIDKEQTWELADQLGVFEYVRDNTLTCYNGIIGKGCGECPSCKLRQNGLEKYEQRRGE